MISAREKTKRYYEIAFVHIDLNEPDYQKMENKKDVEYSSGVNDSTFQERKAAGDHLISRPAQLIARSQSQVDVGINSSKGYSHNKGVSADTEFFDIPIYNEDESTAFRYHENGNKSQTILETRLADYGHDCESDSPKIVPETCCCSCDSQSENSNTNEWYVKRLPKHRGCPYNSLHHTGLPTEFLKNPFYHSADKRSQHILAGMNDHSTGICMKMQFIVNNMKDCLGIWPQLFLQNLTAIVVNADHAIVRLVFSKDRFSILRKLITFYVSETKCEMIFRYWCLFYNAFARNLIPVLPKDLKEKLMAQLQKDFSLASQSLCRCKLESQCNNECEPNEEHKLITSNVQVAITSVLMYYLLCKVGNHSESTCNVYKETPTKLNAERFVKGYLVHHYIKLFEKSSKQQSSKEFVLMEILSHVLIAFHYVAFEKNLFSLAIDAMLDMGDLSAAVKMKDILFRLLEKETDAFRKGPGSKLVFVEPEIHVGFETLGISGVIKCLNNLVCNVEYQILTRDEQTLLLDKMVTMQTFLGDSMVWNGDYENTYLHCRHLQCALERKLGLEMANIAVDTDTDDSTFITEKGMKTANTCCFRITDSPGTTSDTSESKLQAAALAEYYDETADELDDWQIDTKHVSKLRKIYAHELNLGEINNGQEQNFVSRWWSKAIDYILPCKKCCE